MSLAEDQEDLVAALVAGGPVPPGFDAVLVAAAREALLRKRSGEVAAVWPWLAASLGPQWTVEFGRWAAGRPPNGALRDGLDFAATCPRPAGCPRRPARSCADARNAAAGGGG
jgi:hypothetical protein